MSAASDELTRQLGSTLRRLRRECNLTQSQLGDMAGLAKSTISELESGKKGLSIDVLCRLAEPMGLVPQITFQVLTRKHR